MVNAACHNDGMSARPNDQDEPTHSASGVDLTLIRWMQSLTPRQRLDVLQDAVDSIYAIRDANTQR